MQLRAELVHAEPGVRVVQLSAWLNGECLGSTLAEGETVEQAERRAEERLRQRLSRGPNPPEPVAPQNAEPAPSPPQPVATQPSSTPQRVPAPVAPPALPGVASRSPTPTAPKSATETASPGTSSPETASAEAAPAEPPPLDPEDWSDELAQIEWQLQRLGWNREQEGLYLERAFGHPSRNRITTYADLVAYGQALSGLGDGADAASVPVPLRRRDLLSQCDALLAHLGWDGRQGRSFLEQHFQLNSRSQLNDEQLLEFNMLLESELIGASAATARAGGKADGG